MAPNAPFAEFGSQHPHLEAQTACNSSCRGTTDASELCRHLHSRALTDTRKIKCNKSFGSCTHGLHTYSLPFSKVPWHGASVFLLPLILASPLFCRFTIAHRFHQPIDAELYSPDSFKHFSHLYLVKETPRFSPSHTPKFKSASLPLCPLNLLYFPKNPLMNSTQHAWMLLPPSTVTSQNCAYAPCVIFPYFYQMNLRINFDPC